MKKKQLLIGLVAIGVAAASATTVSAAYQFLKQTKNIYTIGYADQCEMSWKSGGKTQCATVSTFDDSGNKCYVALDKESNQPSISCVRMQ